MGPKLLLQTLGACVPASVVLIVPLTVLVVVVLLKAQCSTTVLERTAVSGPVPFLLVTLGVELRTGLQRLKAFLVRDVDVSTLTELETTDVLLERTLLKTPEAMTALNRVGPCISRTV